MLYVLPIFYEIVHMTYGFDLQIDLKGNAFEYNFLKRQCLKVFFFFLNDYKSMKGLENIYFVRKTHEFISHCYSHIFFRDMYFKCLVKVDGLFP